jgi:hypothetical protein
MVHDCRLACDEEFPVKNPINKHFVPKTRDEVLGTRPDKPATSCTDIIFNGRLYIFF